VRFCDGDDIHKENKTLFFKKKFIFAANKLWKNVTVLLATVLYLCPKAAKN